MPSLGRAPRLALLALLAAPSWAATDVYIKLGAQGGGLLKLAAPAFAAADPAKAELALLAKQSHDVVRDDLLFSRRFDVLEDGPHFDGADLKSIAGDWKTRGAGWVLGAKVGQSADLVELTVTLLDVNSGEAVFERYYKQNSRYLRGLSHRVADDVVQALTGKPGIAHTRLAFANDQTGSKEIYVCDYDGSNIVQVTRDRSIALLPRFSPDRKRLAYTSYKDGNPDLFLVDLEKGESRPLSHEQGLNIAGGFSPDGGELLMTLSRGRSPNVYVKSLADGTLTQLTQHSGADSSPTFSPDGQQVAFVSDRAGNPQIYVLEMTTRRATRLTSLNWCDSPSWSPTGEWIAFAGRAASGDPLDIYLVDVTGNNLRRLTNGEGRNENPSWSPDGRFLAFTSTRGGSSQLYVMDADGSAPRKLADAHGSTVTPTWSD